MLKVGILGGSFDPIHNGHIHMAQDAIVKMDLDVVYFMPTSISPLKTHNPIASDIHRYKMVELAIRSHKKLDILDWEILRKGTSYTIDTVKLLKEHWANDRFFWLIGSDIVESLHQWKQVNELVNLVEFIAISRPGHIMKAAKVPNLKLHEVTTSNYNISSTGIRERIKKGEPIKDMLPESVYNYIFINQLYG